MGNLEHLKELKMTLTVSLDCNIGREIENKRKKLAEVDQYFSILPNSFLLLRRPY